MTATDSPRIIGLVGIQCYGAAARRIVVAWCRVNATAATNTTVGIESMRINDVVVSQIR